MPRSCACLSTQMENGKAVSTHSSCGTELNPPLAEGMGWRYCSTCRIYVHGPCGTQNCSCGKEKSTAPRARKAETTNLALAIWDESEVGSTSQIREAPTGDTRPEEGQIIMAAEAKKKATKKATTKVADSDEKKLDKRTDADARRGRGALEALVVSVTDAFEAGKVELPEGKTLTPQRIANIIGEKPGEDKPSGGAVAAILKRWDDAGYALTHAKPYAFKAVSARGKKQGLEDLKEKLHEKKKAERAKEREEAKASKE